MLRDEGWSVSRRLRVEFPALGGSVQDFAGVAEALRSGLARLDEQVTGLVGDSWSGDASAKYSEVWQQWHEGAASVVSGFAKFSERMAATEKAFREAEGGGGGVSGDVR
ncbi:hypothetical protein BKN37_25465 [Mycobacterium talmoniae]|uniref:ESAT-6-like protein n=1 Tax=Mycobacterium talmoniae TaxID=1858794 RepID=A0A1S1MVA0_9MYCO|nr:hypothetical protein BKN37_25465 [Mycobacterium talmoniae]